MECFSLWRALVSPSALQRSVGVYFNLMRLLFIESRTVECRMRKCLFRAEILSVVAVIMAAVLSISVMIGPLLVLNSSLYKGQIHCAATESVLSASYSASQVLCAVTVCFFDHHEIGDPLTKKKTPVVPLGEFILPQLLSDDAVSRGLILFENKRLADLVRET